MAGLCSDGYCLPGYDVISFVGKYQPDTPSSSTSILTKAAGSSKTSVLPAYETTQRPIPEDR
jgi:hypothetical protein